MPNKALPLEKKFAVLCEITRAQHFAWREAVAQLAPDLDARDVVLKMWEVTGQQTAAAFAKRIDRSLPLAPQVAQHIVHSSECMGEDAEVVEGQGGEAQVKHEACPWLKWHDRFGLRDECRPGCDRWFESTVDSLNESLGTTLRVKTLQTLPEGAPSCIRRLWTE